MDRNIFPLIQTIFRIDLKRWGGYYDKIKKRMKQWLLEHEKEKDFLKTMEYSWIATCQLVAKITVAQNSRPKISGVQTIWPKQCGQAWMWPICAC